MKTVYIDITTLLNFPHMTGIQRVVSEISIRLIANQKSQNVEIVLLAHNRDYNFSICDNDKFLGYFMLSWEKKTSCVTSKAISIDQLEPSSFWLDLDGVWVSNIPRNLLYPQLSKRNIQIGVYVYDVIVLSHPQYSSPENYIRFPAYLSAVFDYADFIFTEAEYTKKQIQELAQKIECSRKIQYRIAIPGGNYLSSLKKEKNISESILDIAKKGKILLTVSTLEIRKNHKVLLDAFDTGLCDMGYRMVFVGKTGWKVDELLVRIATHPKNGESLFHLQGLNDDELTYLYENASFVLFPSYIEGYGLATVEAMQHGVPCILSDIPIMREVGKDYCDYFDPNKPGQLIDIIRSYEAAPDQYIVKCEKLKDYQAPSWDMCAKSILDSILEFRTPVRRNHKVKQIVYLSARIENLLETLKHVEVFMPFIRKVLILCPIFMATKIKELYLGCLEVTCLTDDDLLQGRPLPKDHAQRNFLLRCLAMSRPELDDEFIMSDDDYHPLQQVDVSFFINDGRYQAFYCHDLDLWSNNVMIPTSYDLQMLRTNEFLKEHGYPNLQYASHMPQIICKEWYLDLLKEYPGIETMGLDEWGTYFNYAIKKHPESFDVRPYVTMSWPEMVSSWSPLFIPSEFIFENFYEFLYSEGNPFSGLNTALHDTICLDNEKKKLISRRLLEKERAIRKEWRTFENQCNTQYKQFPSFVFCYGENMEPAFINQPPYLEMLNASAYTLPVAIMKRDKNGVWSRSDENIKIAFKWQESSKIFEAVNLNGSGQASVRIATPNDIVSSFINLYYSFDDHEYTFAGRVPVTLKKIS